jgi:SAM-dependent methyltransferase
MVYAPRPSAADLDAKYKFLGLLSSQSKLPVPESADRWRSRKLFRVLFPLLERFSNVLDFGGGDGRLMRDLVAEGYRCFTVDWSEKVVEGVNRLGTTLEDLPVDTRFDAIVASHVVEHIAEPRAVLERLRGHLVPDGILYVEVPLEIWRRVPYMTEPVTHVNFFVPESLKALLGYAGYAVLACTIGTTRYGESPTPVIRAVARNRTAEVALPQPGVAHGQVLRYLNPSRWMRLRHRISMPVTWWTAFAYKLQRRRHRQP